MSRTYHFTLSRGVENDTQISVMEYELTPQQENLLLGEAILNYKNLPGKLKKQFRKKIRSCKG